MSADIDLVEYGSLLQKVQDLDKKVDKLEAGMDELLALANKGRGGFWAGMMIVSAVSSAVGYVSHWFQGGK